jgi:Leucine-rich repeat (LRR) protein
MGVPNCQAAIEFVKKTGQLVVDMPEFKALDIFDDLNIKDLTIIGRIDDQSARNLGKIKNLSSFKLVQSQLDLERLEYLRELPNLTELDLTENSIKDFTPVGSLKRLRKLRIDATALNKPKSLFALNNLSDLTFYGGTYKSLAFLSRFPKLENFSLLHVNSIESTALAAIGTSTSLASFDASTLNSNAKLNLRYLASPYLRTLLLDGFKLTNIKTLSKSNNLVGLTLNRAEINSPAELPPLRYLRRLNLSINPISILPNFERYPDLTMLVLQRANIRTVNLSEIPRLESLILDYNPVCKQAGKLSSKVNSCIPSQTSAL